MVSRRRYGGAALELALVLPVVLLVLAGSLEWGRILVAEAGLVQVARDAALAGARTAADDDPDTAAITRANEALAASGWLPTTAEVDVSRTTLACGESLVVRIQAPWTATTRLAPVPEQLSATVTARLEDQ